MIDEATKPFREDVARDPGALLEVCERPRVVHRVANDQRAQPVSDEVERTRDWARRVGPGHVVTAAYSGQTSSVIGGYMIFYSLGSALGATATTTIYSTSGWTGCAVLGASFALCGLLTWALSRRTRHENAT